MALIYRKKASKSEGRVRRKHLPQPTDDALSGESWPSWDNVDEDAVPENSMPSLEDDGNKTLAIPKRRGDPSAERRDTRSPLDHFRSPWAIPGYLPVRARSRPGHPGHRRGDPGHIPGSLPRVTRSPVTSRSQKDPFRQNTQFSQTIFLK